MIVLNIFFGNDIVHIGNTPAQKKWRPCSHTYRKDLYSYLYIYIYIRLYIIC